MSKAVHNLSTSNQESVLESARSFIDSTLTYKHYQLVSISLPNDYQMNYLSQLTKTIIGLFNEDIAIYHYYDNSRNSVLILNYDDETTQLYIANTLTTFLKNLKDQVAPATRIALTSVFESIADFQSVTKQLNQIMSAKILYAPYSLMIHDVNSTVENTSRDMVKQLSIWFIKKKILPRLITSSTTTSFKRKLIIWPFMTQKKYTSFYSKKNQRVI